jgi:hypothetical protein
VSADPSLLSGNFVVAAEPADEVIDWAQAENGIR